MKVLPVKTIDAANEMFPAATPFLFGCNIYAIFMSQFTYSVHNNFCTFMKYDTNFGGLITRTPDFKKCRDAGPKDK